jgi:hypothetical protein
MIRYFWWGEEKGQRKIHWLEWEKMLHAKCNGGLGFRDMRKFNQAILARQAWRLIQFLDRLCARVLKVKYYPMGSWWIQSSLVRRLQLGEQLSMGWSWSREELFGISVQVPR